jgi:hypothetical protein
MFRAALLGQPPFQVTSGAMKTVTMANEKPYKFIS